MPDCRASSNQGKVQAAIARVPENMCPVDFKIRQVTALSLLFQTHNILLIKARQEASQIKRVEK